MSYDEQEKCHICKENLYVDEHDENRKIKKV